MLFRDGAVGGSRLMQEVVIFIWCVCGKQFRVYWLFILVLCAHQVTIGCALLSEIE